MDDLLIRLAILGTSLIKLVDDDVLVARVEILLPLHIEDRRSKVPQTCDSLRDDELLLSLDDSVVVSEHASGEDVALCQLEVVEDGGADTRVLFIFHLDEGDTISLVSLRIDGNIDSVFLQGQVLLATSLRDDALELGDLFLRTLRQIVDHEVLFEIFVQFGRVFLREGIRDL